MYTNTKITQADTIQWINDFQKAVQMLKREGVLSDMDKAFIRRRISDALFLVAYVESQLAIDVADEVYDRARALQRAEQTEPSFKKFAPDIESGFIRPQTEPSTDCSWK